MHRRLLHVYLASMCVAAVVAVALTDWSVLASLPGDAQLGLIALIAVGVLSESLAIRFTVGEATGNTSITFIPLLAGVQLFGAPAGVLLIAITGATGEILRRKQELMRNVFNFAQLVVAAALAGWAEPVNDFETLWVIN